MDYIGVKLAESAFFDRRLVLIALDVRGGIEWVVLEKLAKHLDSRRNKLSGVLFRPPLTELALLIRHTSVSLRIRSVSCLLCWVR